MQMVPALVMHAVDHTCGYDDDDVCAGVGDAEDAVMREEEGWVMSMLTGTE